MMHITSMFIIIMHVTIIMRVTILSIIIIIVINLRAVTAFMTTHRRT